MKELIKETIKNFEELKKNLSYNDTEENYCNLVNIAVDYDNEAQDDLYLYDTIHEICEFVDEEIMDYLIKENSSSLTRLRCFIGDTFDAVIYKLDGYGNLENVEDDDFEYCIDECIERLNDKLKELENEK